MTNRAGLQSGTFALGFNYWASHAGLHMWKDWRPEIVEDDLRRLASYGVDTLRVFPLWPDFQPITLHRKYLGLPNGIMYGEERLGTDELGRAGMSPEAMEHFSFLADTAEKYHIRLIVGLLTGWMSGRLFVPPALEGLNVITDPKAVYWEVQFCETFVKYFKDKPSIVAWDLGNECNCMGAASTREEGWWWTYTIASAIRRSDATRPILSGMHSLDISGEWTIRDQAASCDILTIHPYKFFTDYCNLDPTNTIRSVMHSPAELCMYRDIGGKPCLVEEVGLTDISAGEEVMAKFARSNMFASYAYDGLGMLWWCACYEKDYDKTPYTWDHGERGMGLLMKNGEKVALKEFAAFKEFLASLPFDRLPARRIDASCILGQGKGWPVAFGSFMLAAETGFDITFNSTGGEIKQADVYMLPCFERADMGKELWEEMLEKVYNGATLYVSTNGALGTGYQEPFGFIINDSWQRPETVEIVLEGTTYNLRRGSSLDITVTGAEVLLQDKAGKPVLMKSRYGKGTLYTAMVSIEQDFVARSDVAYTSEGNVHRHIYSIVFRDLLKKRLVLTQNYQTVATEHHFKDDRVVVMMINYAPERVQEDFTVQEGWKVESVYYGDTPKKSTDSRDRYSVSIRECDACMFELVRE